MTSKPRITFEHQSRIESIDRWLATEVRTMIWGPPLDDLTDDDSRRVAAQWFQRQIHDYFTWLEKEADNAHPH